jgi:acetoin utilization protein AcuB
MRLKDFMSRDVETVTTEDTVETAYQKMRLRTIRHLVVLDGKKVVGVLSQRDINGMDERKREGQRVGDILEASAVTAGPETTLREAANLMRGRTIGCLPIVEHHKLVGIITTTDILDLLGQGIERISPDVPKRPITRDHPAQKPAGFNPKLSKT